MNKDMERAAFEAIAKDQCLPLRRTGCTYDDDATQAAWAVYLQARAALATAQTEIDTPPATTVDTAPMYKALLESRIALLAVNSGASNKAIALIDSVLAAAPAKPEGV